MDMTIATEIIAAAAGGAVAGGPNDHVSALRFITCGSVDDGKSTLIGRLLVDSKAVLQDHLAGVQRQGETDLALLTDGLSAEREQGITIDVAYRYFATESRKFIIGDAPGHSLLANLLRVPSIVFAINKLDAVDAPDTAFAHIGAALTAFAEAARIPVKAIVPVSALKGWNVVDARAGWCAYHGPSLLQLLERLPNTPADTGLPLAFPVQWVEKFSSSSDTRQGRRVFWGRVATGSLRPGQSVKVQPGGQTAQVAQVLDHARRLQDVPAGRSAGIVLDRELDVSRGDWLLADGAGAPEARRELRATIAWLDDEPLVAGRAYWALHGHRWVKAKVRRIVHRLDVNTLAKEEASQLEPNAIGHVELTLQEPITALPYTESRTLGALVLVDTASHKTSGAVLIQ
jgi:sulfate adenylyltransferase subunit 1